MSGRCCGVCGKADGYLDKDGRQPVVTYFLGAERGFRKIFRCPEHPPHVYPVMEREL